MKIHGPNVIREKDSQTGGVPKIGGEAVEGRGKETGNDVKWSMAVRESRNKYKINR